MESFMWRMWQPREQPARAPQRAQETVEALEADEGESGLSRDEVAAILARHAEAARYAALALVGPADAEDAVQEALVRGWRAWMTLRDPAAARAWLVRITINVCRDWQRGRFGTHMRLTEPLEGADLRGLTLLVSDPGASNHAAALDLRNAINRLDQASRVVVVLRYYAGLDATEIGAALGIPASTARTRLSRALVLLRDYLGDSGEWPAISRQEDTNA
jgi:RNA polymerase sigma-70 factor (ECF subfamily)